MVKRRSSWALAGLSSFALGASLAACQTDARCGAPSGCDIRHESCQKSALRYAVCLRGRNESPDLDIELVTQKRADFVAARVAEAEAGDTANDRSLRRGLALFSLSPTDSDVESETRVQFGHVGAIYDSDPPRITVVDDGYRLAGNNVATLVHEMVHALQDAAGELDVGSVPPRFDAQLAHRAIVEGEATIFGDETWAAGNDLTFDASRYRRALNSYRAYTSYFFFRTNDVFSQLYSRFSYAQGASYLWPLRRDDGAAAIARAHAMPPVSTYAVMELDPEHPEQRENELGEDAVPVLPKLSLTATMHLGRFAYEAYSDVVDPGILHWLLPQGREFVADTLSVFSSDDDAVLAVWRLRFDNEAAVSRFMTGLTDYEVPLRVGSEGSDVWIMMAENDALLDALPSELTWQTAPESDGAVGDRGAASPRIACMIHGEAQ